MPRASSVVEQQLWFVRVLCNFFQDFPRSSNLCRNRRCSLVAFDAAGKAIGEIAGSMPGCVTSGTSSEIFRGAGKAVRIGRPGALKIDGSESLPSAPPTGASGISSVGGGRKPAMRGARRTLAASAILSTCGIKSFSFDCPLSAIVSGLNPCVSLRIACPGVLPKARIVGPDAQRGHP